MKPTLKHFLNLGKWQKFLIALPIYFLIIFIMSFLKDFQNLSSRLIFSFAIGSLLSLFSFVLKRRK